MISSVRRKKNKEIIDYLLLNCVHHKTVLNTTNKCYYKNVPFSDKRDQTPLNAVKFEADFLTSLQLNNPAFKKYIAFDSNK